MVTAGPATARLADPHARMPALDPALAAILMAAAEALPAGWRAELVGGERYCAAILLFDDHDRRLAPLSRAERGAAYTAYRGFADSAWRAMRRLHPGLEGKLAWGGRFTTAGGEWRLGHFDLAGPRGRGKYRPPPEKLL